MERSISSVGFSAEKYFPHLWQQQNFGQCRSINLEWIASQEGRCIGTRDLYESTIEPKYEPALIMSWKVELRGGGLLAAETALLSGNSEQRVEKEASLGNDVHCTLHYFAWGLL